MTKEQIAERRRQLAICVQLRNSAEPDADEGLIEYARSSDARIRLIAILFLGGRQAPQALDLIIDSLNNEVVEHNRAMSVVALGRYDDPRAFQALLNAVPDAPDSLRCALGAVIGWRSDADAIPILLPLLHNKDWQLRRRACESLLRSGHYGDDVLAVLQELEVLPECRDYEAQNAQVEKVAADFIAEKYPGEESELTPDKTVSDLIAEIVHHRGNSETRG